MKPLYEARDEFEKAYILKAIGAAGGKRSRAAEMLGITRKTMWAKIHALGISLREIGAAMAQTDNAIDEKTSVSYGEDRREQDEKNESAERVARWQKPVGSSNAG